MFGPTQKRFNFGLELNSYIKGLKQCWVKHLWISSFMYFSPFESKCAQHLNEMSSVTRIQSYHSVALKGCLYCVVYIIFQVQLDNYDWPCPNLEEVRNRNLKQSERETQGANKKKRTGRRDEVMDVRVGGSSLHRHLLTSKLSVCRYVTVNSFGIISVPPLDKPPTICWLWDAKSTTCHMPWWLHEDRCQRVAMIFIFNWNEVTLLQNNKFFTAFKKTFLSHAQQWLCTLGELCFPPWLNIQPRLDVYITKTKGHQNTEMAPWLSQHRLAHMSARHITNNENSYWIFGAE